MSPLGDHTARKYDKGDRPSRELILEGHDLAEDSARQADCNTVILSTDVTICPLKTFTICDVIILAHFNLLCIYKKITVSSREVDGCFHAAGLVR